MVVLVVFWFFVRSGVLGEVLVRVIGKSREIWEVKTSKGMFDIYNTFLRI